MADKNENRFVETYTQSTISCATRIIVDKETGVNYLWRCDGYAGGLTPLLDKDGKPIVTEFPPKSF